MSAFLHHVYYCYFALQWQDLGILWRLHAPFMSVFIRIRTNDGYIGHSSWTSHAGAKRSQKQEKIVNLELTNNSRRKPTAKGVSSRFNDQLYGRTKLVRPYSYHLSRHLKQFRPVELDRRDDIQNTKKSQKLRLRKGSGGGTHPPGSIFILRRSGRPRHRSSSSTTASPPSPSIPSTSHIHLVVIPLLVVDLYKYNSFMIGSIIIAMMLIASMSEQIISFLGDGETLALD